MNYTAHDSSGTPPGLKTTQIYRGVLPFVAIQLNIMGLLAAFPDIVLKAGQ